MKLLNFYFSSTSTAWNVYTKLLCMTRCNRISLSTMKMSQP